MRFGLLLFLLVSTASVAQYSGPAVESCLAYANKNLTQTGVDKASVVVDRDANLSIERYAKKAGSQFVSSLLVGNGAIVYPKGLAVEVSFLCLLANDKQAVFFDWRPRRDASVLSLCRRGKDAAGCLESLLLLAEQDLTALYSKHFIDARQADSAAGNENGVTAFRKSADAFKAYRDAECARQAKGEAFTACMIELTRRRAQDLK
jgi:uncharacterized protein YecT (DUF1311 family)